jgi:hypothetical protein
MPAGIDFVAYLNARVEACDLFLAVIGPDWLDAKNATGGRRLHDPEDYVALEIAAALQRDIPVIPVLIDGARVPQSDQLPEPLKPLVRRNAVEVRNAQFRRDADALTEKVHEALRIRRPRRSVQVGLAALLLGLAGLGLIVFQTGLPGWLAGIQGAPGPNARGADTAATEPAAPSTPLQAPPSKRRDRRICQTRPRRRRVIGHCVKPSLSAWPRTPYPRPSGRS